MEGIFRTFLFYDLKTLNSCSSKALISTEIMEKKHSHLIYKLIEFLAQLFVNIFELHLTRDDSFYRNKGVVNKGVGNKGVVNGLHEKEHILAVVFSCFTVWRRPNLPSGEKKETQTGSSPPSWEVPTWWWLHDLEDKAFFLHMY